MKRAVSVLFLVFLGFFTFSCARQQNSGARMSPVFDTQVKNAVRLGDGDLEILALRKRLMDHPTDTAVRRKLAARFEASGYPDLALEHLRIAFEHAPADIGLGLDLATSLSEQGLKTQALQVVGAVLKSANASAPELSRAAILKDGFPDLAAGEALHRQALALEPTSPQRLNNLAYNLILQHRASEAEPILRQVLRSKPSYELARNNLAALYATQLNQPEEALSHWKAISGPAAAHNNLAAVYMEQGKWPEAKKELEKALALRFQFPEAIQNLQIVAARNGGTVELKLDRDKHQSGLTKLAMVFKNIFVTEEEETAKSKYRRSRP